MEYVLYIISYGEINTDIALIESSDYFKSLNLHWTSMLKFNDWELNQKFEHLQITKELFESFSEGIYTNYKNEKYICIFPIEKHSIYEKILLIDILNIEE